jgi:lysozyme
MESKIKFKENIMKELEETRVGQEVIARAVAWTKGQSSQPIVADVKPCDNNVAVRIATKLIKQSEGCSLLVYPDPASELSIKLSQHDILAKYIAGNLVLPPYLDELDGSPWTQGWGETKGVVKGGPKWTQEQADSKLAVRVKEFMQEVLTSSPNLAGQSAEKIAAITSLAYNIGITQYNDSTARKRIATGDWKGAAEAMQWFNKANGKVNQGLVNRRKVEADLFMSVQG